MMKYFCGVLLTLGMLGCAKPKPEQVVFWSAQVDAVPPPGCTLSGDDNMLDCHAARFEMPDKWTVQTWPYPCQKGHTMQDSDGTTYECAWVGRSAPPKGTLRWAK